MYLHPAHRPTISNEPMPVWSIEPSYRGLRPRWACLCVNYARVYSYPLLSSQESSKEARPSADFLFDYLLLVKVSKTLLALRPGLLTIM